MIAVTSLWYRLLRLFVQSKQCVRLEIERATALQPDQAGGVGDDLHGRLTAFGVERGEQRVGVGPLGRVPLGGHRPQGRHAERGEPAQKAVVILAE